MAITHRKRFVLVAAAALGTATYFWAVSRYPDLAAKAMLARSGTVADTISARPLYQVANDAPYLERVWLTAVNWAHDNRKGMAFGVVFAAMLLTLIGYLSLPRRQNRLANTLYGFFIGAPLGVCVNCAAPIFKGLLRSERTETAFAAMLSSPTMNIVVLTMTFTFFPLYMALTKVAFALVTIFVALPLASRWLGAGHKIADLERQLLGARYLTPKLATESLDLDGLPNSLISTDAATNAAGAAESWPQAATAAIRAFGRNLWFMTSRTVPLMLASGLLGAALSHAVPFRLLTEAATPWTILITAFVGVVLPVPMGFDVMLSNALYAQGAPVAVVMTLLCTLGIYSVYSFLITWQSASRQWAILLAAFILSFGTLVGLAAPALHHVFYIGPNLRTFRAAFAAATQAEGSATQLLAEAPVPPQTAAKPPIVFTRERQDGKITLLSSPLAALHSVNPPRFRQLEGHEIGLTRGFRYGIRDYPDPFWIGRGTAAGDFNNDGWQDLAFGSDHGVLLYANRGGWFEPQPDLLPPDVAGLNVYAVAFVDFDNDGWLDLFISTYGSGNFILRNDSGSYAQSPLLPVPNNNAVLTVSPAFADVDHDGYADIVNGNMALGIVTGFNRFSDRRASSLVLNHALQFSEMPLGGDQGETMATLVADFRGDGQPDLLLGHDFVYPDSRWRGDGHGNFVPRPLADGPAATPVFTMGLDSGDLNNDLHLDLVMMGTTERAPWVGSVPIDGVGPRVYSEPKDGPAACAEIRDSVVRANCEVLRSSDHLLPFYAMRNLSMPSCAELTSPLARQDCLLSMMWLLMTHEDQKWDCAADFASDERLAKVCSYLQSKGARRTSGDFPGSLPQIDGNYVYLGDGTGHLVDINAAVTDSAGVATKPFIHPGGWTWNVKIADLDNDGWQDIFNAEGAVRTNDYGFNAFMKNVEGKRFEAKQFSYNLTNAFNLHSFALIDIDNDGALDIVGNSSTGPVQVYLNEATEANARLAVSLRDFTGQRTGLGAMIYVREAGNGGQQMREIKASGGYLSFDAPVAYFGLGRDQEIAELRVRWADGSETRLPGPLAAGKHYLIERR